MNYRAMTVTKQDDIQGGNRDAVVDYIRVRILLLGDRKSTVDYKVNLHYLPR